MRGIINEDGLLKNFYLYKQNNNTPIKIALWDYDHSFGRDGDNELNMLRSSVDFNRSILFDRLMKNDDYLYRLKKRWYELRSNGVFSLENFQAKVNENKLIIHPYLAHNFNLWPIDEKWYFDSNSFEEEIVLMTNFVKQNINRLDQLFDYNK